jgi:hypothetical protein
MSSQGPPQHLPLDALIILATRLLALPIFRRPNLNSPEGEVLRRFCPSLASLRAARRLPQLSAFLTARLTEAQAHAATLPLDEQTLLTPKLQALSAVVASVTCTSCSRAGGHLCDGINERQDDQQIDSVGLCLQLIRDTHGHVLSTVETVLREWVGVEEGDLAGLPHQWATNWSGRAQRQLPTTQWKVDAETDFQDAPPERLSEIRLTLAVEELDWDSLLAIHWLLTHELLCHVYQRPPPRGKAREPCRPYCPFFEGWMDELAHAVLKADLVAGWLGATRCTFVVLHREEIVQAASDYRRDRYDTGPGANRRLLAPQWELGVESARAVRQLLETVSPEADESARRRVALAQLAALSFRIQGSAPSPAQLDKVVHACLLACRRELSGGTAESRGQLLDRLTRPIRNIFRWIKDL